MTKKIQIAPQYLYWSAQRRCSKASVRSSKEEQKWESNIKIELPKFYGSLNHEEFMDWLNQVEKIFDFHEVPDSKKVKLISIKLRGRTSAWWEQLQVQRVRIGKRKIQDWCKMKQKMRNKFLPFNYMQSLYKQQHNFK